MLKRKIKIGFEIVVGALALCVMAAIIPIQADAIQINEDWEISGFIRNNTGVFTENQDFVGIDTKGELATERTWLRLKLDGNIFPELRLYIEGQAVYEPEYKVEKGSGTSTTEYSEQDFREVYLQWKPFDTFGVRAGKQIVTWGESLAFRVGDVINPQDNRFAFSFANLEDTRMPQWMVRGIHQIPSIGSSFEWIVNPLLTQEKYRVDRWPVSAVPPTDPDDPSTATAGQRFALYPETRVDLIPPFSLEMTPTDLSWLYELPPGYVVVDLPTEVPVAEEEIPDDDLGDARFGCRTSTTVGGWNFGLSYWHSHEFNPVFERGDLTGGSIPIPGMEALYPMYKMDERKYTIMYPEVDIIGAYTNKCFSQGVLRTELTFRPDRQYNTLNLEEEPDAIAERDNLQYLIAWDMNKMFRPLNKNGSFDIRFEYYGNYVMGDTDDLHVSGYITEIEQIDHQFLLNITTDYNYGMYTIDLLGIYDTRGDGIFMPSIKYAPDWLNNHFTFELKYIRIFGDNDFEGMGMFRQKDLVVLTSQWTF